MREKGESQNVWFGVAAVVLIVALFLIPLYAGYRSATEQNERLQALIDYQKTQIDPVSMIYVPSSGELTEGWRIVTIFSEVATLPNAGSALPIVVGKYASVVYNYKQTNSAIFVCVFKIKDELVENYWQFVCNTIPGVQLSENKFWQVSDGVPYASVVGGLRSHNFIVTVFGSVDSSLVSDAEDIFNYIEDKVGEIAGGTHTIGGWPQ